MVVVIDKNLSRDGGENSNGHNVKGFDGEDRFAIAGCDDNGLMMVMILIR